MPESDIQRQLDDARTAIASLRDRIQQLEQSPGGLPRTSLLDGSFLKRAFTVWGHNFVAELIIAIPFIILMLMILGVTSAFRF